jgi:Tfp pilus assembly protein PilV
MGRPVPRRRRGIALFDAIIGGVILGIGLSVLLSITARSLAMQTAGEKRLTASWLADELLAMVLVEGPDRYPMLYDTAGAFGPPFEEFAYEVDITNLGRDAPYQVNAFVRWSDRPRDQVQVETLIALRAGEFEQLREPLEPVDRDARYYDDVP